MDTQILPRPVYSNEQHRATLRCPQCGRTKVADVAKYQDAPRLPKVKCPCGHRFRSPSPRPCPPAIAVRNVRGKGTGSRRRGKKCRSLWMDIPIRPSKAESRAPCVVARGALSAPAWRVSSRVRPPLSTAECPWPRARRRARCNRRRPAAQLQRRPGLEQHLQSMRRNALLYSWLRVFRSVDMARLGSGRRPQHHRRRGEEKNAWNSEPERGAGMR